MRYTEEQKEKVKNVYQTCDENALQRLTDELGISRTAMRQLARRLGVKRPPECHSKRGEAFGLANRGRRKHCQELVDALSEYYPTHSRKECAEHFGIKESLVAYLAHGYGMKRNRRKAK